MSERDLRYTATIDVRAAYSEMEVGLADLVRDHRREILDLLEHLRQRDPVEVEEQIYKKIKLDLCPRCQKIFIANPLRFSPGQQPKDYEIDIDAFLRSLGFGDRRDQT
jgi:hypothetical protein